MLCQSTNPRPSVEDSEAPSTLDYDMWLGPAPERPFNNSRFRGWRGFGIMVVANRLIGGALD